MKTQIHATAIVSSRAKIGANCKIGAFTSIGDDVEIGDNSEVGSYCEIGIDSGLIEGKPLVIGKNSLIRSGSIFYLGSQFGKGLRTGHRVTVREGVRAGEGLQIGTLSDLQGNCIIGDHVRLHSNVHIGQKSEIGNFVWIFPYVVLTNDPHPPSSKMIGCKVEDFVAIATMSTVLPGSVIGRGALVGAMTLVRGNIPADSIVIGSPGKVIGLASKILFKESQKPVYPWRRHFHRGYPEDIVCAWKKEFPDG